MQLPLRFTQAARKHKIGREAVREALRSAGAPLVIAEEGKDDRLIYLGRDGRGRELEIIAVLMPGYFLIIHAMPTALRRSRS
ncbi:MAG: hypothetical protein ACR2JX_02545 [Mycobacteriales bacterium]